jgi:hypothetical protein
MLDDEAVAWLFPYPEESRRNRNHTPQRLKNRNESLSTRLRAAFETARNGGQIHTALIFGAVRALIRITT